MQTFKKKTHTTKFSMFPSLLKKLKIMCKNPHYLKCQKYKNFYSRKKSHQHSTNTVPAHLKVATFLRWVTLLVIKAQRHFS